MTLFNILKNIVAVLIFLLIAPAMLDGIKKQYTRYVTPQTQVGVITIKGILCDSNHYNKYLHTYFKDSNIKAILLKIECPGGAAGTSQALFTEIQALKKEYPKPVVALVENVCASGGYYVACAADYIIAPGSALVGSIGVCLPYYFQLHGLLEHLKVDYVSIKAGAYKSVGDPFTNITTEQKALLQSVLDDTYEQFTVDVAQQRKLSPDTAHIWADGKIFSGNQARKLGLIDQIGSAYMAIQILKEKALIEGDIEWIKPPEESSAWSLLTGSSNSDDDSMFGSMTKKMGALLQEQTVTTALDSVLPNSLHMR